ncbi:MAG: competence protein ComEC [Parcubacteria group bacterium Gr01-1014_38]|nr:MAG: competence protein ComEC [Parcubacteria group bacterium Gr01-1014_38]
MRPWVVPWMGVGWLAGILVGSLTVVPVVLLTASGISAALAYAVSWSRALFSERGAQVVRLSALTVLAGMFGIWRANGALLFDQGQQEQWDPFYGRPAVVRGVVRDAEIRGVLVRLTIGQLSLKDRAVLGMLRTTVPRSPGIGENAVIRLRGKLERPEDLPRLLSARTGQPVRGDLERVFRRQQVFATMRFPDVRIETAARPSVLTRVRFSLRDLLLQQLPDPAAGLYSALLLSFDRDLPSSLREAAAATGILHLVAISGSHIAAIAAVAFFIAVTAGLSRTTAAMTTLAFTAVFLALVGFPESGVRSGIMAGLVLFATLLGRHAAGLRALLLAIVVMAAIDPRVLLGDVGLQLSALAVWGLLTIFPFLQQVFRQIPDPLRLRSLILLTIAAELATLPVVVYTFGRIPLFGPLTNLAAGVLFPFLLALGALVLLTSVVAPAMTALVAPLATLLGNAFLGIAERVSAIPGHLITVPPVSLTFFLTSLVSLLVVGHLLQRRPRSATTA